MRHAGCDCPEQRPASPKRKFAARRGDLNGWCERAVAFATGGSRDPLTATTANRQDAKTPRLLVGGSRVVGTGSAIHCLAAWRLGSSTGPSDMHLGSPRAAASRNAIAL